ncbi:[protein-PII] uridylyltransferase [Guyparkeria halophila]|uniref:Bifunctional uridylyltransferase/uridylyl-removing enzyme n=1 Tax=Guyparkeria halophila TaxID=47960 RepID=A0ABZ0YYL7_9GAMM|nr:[protein-PII] uridylyltransferase [Guyparkeria halophila]WQH16327.1 [protein-PII] uridylyltransferase [Guyparkeria halophila]
MQSTGQPDPDGRFGDQVTFPADRPLARQLETLNEHWAEALADETNARGFIREVTARVDSALRTLWQDKLADTPCALVAVGGYGRGEMFVHSDIDIMVLTADHAHDEAVQAFLYTLWDTGLSIGYAVRSVEECLEAATDPTVYTSLIEMRLIAGDEDLLTRLDAAIRDDAAFDPAWFFAAKLDEQQARYESHDNVGTKIEPHIKEGPGGLRDLHTIRWLANRIDGAPSLAAMHRRGELLRDDEYRALLHAESLLFRIRIGLHGLAERAEERLLLTHQKTLAGAFGYEGLQDGNLAVERFMQHFFRATIEVERLNQLLIQRWRERLHPEILEPIQRLNPRFVRRGRLIETRDAQVFMRSPTAILELFLLLAEHPDLEGMTAATARQLRANLSVIDAGFRANRHAKQLFMRLLRAERGVYLALRNMNLTGVLAAYIPNFAPIVGLMQFDLFHAYTVDTHTLLVIRNLRRPALPEYRDENPIASDAFKRIPRPEVLYLAGLFHDIAKGRGGDHAELGAFDARDFARAHGLPREDIDLVGWLVEQHLLLSFTAQRQDIEDPEVIRRFAEQVGSAEQLDYLYLLTVADIRATNPQLWNSWRDTLLRRLFELTHQHFAEGVRSSAQIVRETRRDANRQGSSEGMDAAKLAAWLSGMPEEYFLRNEIDNILRHSRVAVDADLPALTINDDPQHQATQILILAQNHPALFAHVVAGIDREGLNVQSANITVIPRPLVVESGLNAIDGDGNREPLPESELILLEFFVLDRQGHAVSDPGAIEALHERLEGVIQRPERALSVTRRRTPAQLSSLDVDTEVEFIADVARARTMIQVLTKDRPGLLADLSDTLWRMGAILLHARIATLGERAEDAFFVVDQYGHPINDREHQQAIAEALIHAAKGNAADGDA